MGHHSLQSPGARRVRRLPGRHLELARDQRRCCSPERTALARRDPALPRLAGQQQPQEGWPPAPSAWGGDQGPGSPRSTPGAPHLPLLSTDQSHTGSQVQELTEDPWACPTGLLTASGNVGGQTTNGSLPPAGAREAAGLQHCRAGQLRPGRRDGGLAPGAPVTASLSLQALGCGRRQAPPRACTALPEDRGPSAEVEVPKAAGPGAVLDHPVPEEQFSQVTGAPWLCTETGAPGMSPTLAGTACPGLGPSQGGKPQTQAAPGPGSGAPK